MGTRTKVIAEVASNHGGDIKLAKQFIRVAAECGADYVKFQSWQGKNLRPDDSQYDWFIRSELSDKAHLELMEECRVRGIRFLTTCFEAERVPFLASLGLKEIKVGSADTGSYRMLGKLRQHFEHILISTGMATEDEVRGAAAVLEGKAFTFMHTVSLYPTPVAQANVRRMHWLRQFTPSIGYSDHTVGVQAIKLSIAMGADYVEKHFCLSREGAGRAMPWDMTPKELEEVVRFTHEVETLLGNEQLPVLPELADARKRFIGRFGNNR